MNRLTRCHLTLAALLLLVTALGPARAAEETPCYLDRLFFEMLDPEGLATLAKTTTYGLASSADGKRTTDHYAGADGEGRSVLCELKGPGCVRRMFFAGAIKMGDKDFLQQPRALLFFFDGETQPRLTTTIQTLAQDLADWNAVPPGAGRRPGPARALVGDAGGGYFSYLPMPYEKSLRIVLNTEKLRGFSYQIGYHTYRAKPEGLASWTRESLTAALSGVPGKELIGRTEDPEVSPVTGFGGRFWRQSPLGEPAVEALAPGQSSQPRELQGPGIIRELDLTWTRGDLATIRGLVLRAYWDGEEKPSLEVPVDDLFGFDHGNATSARLYLIAREDGKSGVRRGRLWLPMPFEKSAKLVLVNENGKTGETIPVAFKIQYKRLRELDPSFARLHAQWVRTAQEEGRTAPHTVLDVQGEGRLIGVLLSVNKARSGRRYLLDPEQMVLDGQALGGTSMENFFNGFFSYRSRFGAAFHGVPIQRKGNVTQFRFFVPDSIPFAKSFKLSFPYAGENYASVAFWYQQEPHAAYPPLPSLAERNRFHRRFTIPGALEAEEDIKTVSVSRGNYTTLQPVSMEDEEGDWSNDTQMIFKGPYTCDWCVIRIPVKQAGDYEVVLHMTQGQEYTEFAVHKVKSGKEDDPGELLKITGPDGKQYEVFDAKAEELKPVRLSLGVQRIPAAGLLLRFLKSRQMTRWFHGDKGPGVCFGMDAVELIPKEGGK